MHDNDNIGIDFIGREGVCPNPANDMARDGLCAGNTVYGIDSEKDGNGELTLQYDVSGLIIENNIFIANEQNLFISNPYEEKRRFVC